MRRLFILGSIVVLLLLHVKLSYSLPPPCEFYPNSGYQGETLDLHLYLLCGVPYADEPPKIIFNERGIKVLEITGDSSDECRVKVRIAPYTTPGTYSPHIVLGNRVVLTSEEARSYWLTLTVLESPPQFSLYPENRQRRGTFGIYLILGMNTHFNNGSTFVSSNDPGIFPVLQFVFSPTALLSILWVDDYVEIGNYDLTVITGDEEITESEVLKVVD